MRSIGVVVVLSLLLIFTGAHAFASGPEKGTFAVGASSDVLAGHMDSSDGYSDKTIGFGLEMGYFLTKNWEIGAEVSSSFSFNDNRDSAYYGLKPFIGFHFALNEKSGLYARAGVGYNLGDSNYDDGFDSDWHESTLFGEVGYEFFLTQNIALDFGILAERFWYEREYNDDPYESGEFSNGFDSTSNSITSRLRFRLYF